jgi:hypothetical protein
MGVSNLSEMEAYLARISSHDLNEMSLNGRPAKSVRHLNCNMPAEGQEI